MCEIQTYIPPEIWYEILSYNRLPVHRRVCKMVDEVEMHLYDKRVSRSDILTAYEKEDWEYIILVLSYGDLHEEHCDGCICHAVCADTIRCCPSIATLMRRRCLNIEIPPSFYHPICPPFSTDTDISHKDLYRDYDHTLSVYAAYYGKTEILKTIEHADWNLLARVASKRGYTGTIIFCLRRYDAVVYEMAMARLDVDVISHMNKKFKNKKGKWI